MKQTSKASNFILSQFFIALSLIGLSILVVQAFNFSTVETYSNFQKHLFYLMFSGICILGVTIGVFPSRCSQITHLRERNMGFENLVKIGQKKFTIAYVGHHPSCGKFTSHLLLFRGENYCAGCTGLVTGAIISLFGSLMFFSFDLQIGEASVVIFWIGFLAVVSSLLQNCISKVGRGVVHFFLNVAFVLGAFLLLIGISEITSSLVTAFYLFALMIFWIMTRIVVSRIEHKKVCAECLQSCSRL